MINQVWIQRSAARDTGDTGITVYLDRRPADQVAAKVNKVLIIVAEIENLLNNNQVGDLTVSKLKKEVTRIVPAGYTDISDSVLNYLSGLDVPTDKVPDQVIRNIKSLLQGVKVGVSEYKMSDRKPVATD